METNFYKFPSTPHLAILGNIDVRKEKVLSEEERQDFLKNEITVEEKIDGANLGLSFDSSGNLLIQNRGQFIQPPFSGQWKSLPNWVNSKIDLLFKILSGQYILFGEWCYAQHSVAYRSLPDWFIGFDVYDKNESKFLSTARRDSMLNNAEISIVPNIGRGFFSLQELVLLFESSRFGDEPMEGLYLRVQNDNWLLKRTKLVQKQFIQSIDAHWIKKGIRKNIIAS